MKLQEIDILRFFSAEEIEAMAVKAGFVRRESPVTGLKFFLMFTTGLLNTPEGTLSQLAAFLSSTSDTNVTPQAIDARLNTRAMDFLALCLSAALSMLSRAPARADRPLEEFEHVYIIDSTTFDLHPSLSGIFRGSGGLASRSAMRIQLVFDYKTGRIFLEIGDVDLSDYTTLANIIREEKLPFDGASIILHDLGYFKTTTLASMGKTANLFFVSKLRFGVGINRKDGSPLDLKALLKKQPKDFDIEIDINGAPARVVGVRLHDSIVNSRIRTANNCSEAKTGRISKGYRAFLHYAVVVTNLPAAFTMKQLHALYRIRWQVELVFKVWKSILSIHRICSARKARVLTEIYGKLIMAVILCSICSVSWGNPGEVLISMHKTARYLQTIAGFWAIAIMKGGTRHKVFFMNMLREINRGCRKTAQRNKPTVEQILINSGVSDARLSAKRSVA
jgi:hypothetical protein